MEVLAEVEHNRWSVEELLSGFRPVTDEEQQIIEAWMGVRIYDRCISAAIPLIAKKIASSSI